MISRKEAIEKGLSSYFTGKPCANGHLSERAVYNWKCRQCERDHLKRWRAKNKGYDKARYKERPDVREKKTALASAYYEKNKESVNERKKIYHAKKYEENKPKRKKYFDEWKRRDSSIAIMAMRRFLRRMIDYKKPSKTESVLKYSRSCLVSHIESLFKDGMSWDNYGEWHIDHIKPISVFVSEGITDPSIVNALENLQPLWAFDNISKGSKYVQTL